MPTGVTLSCPMCCQQFTLPSNQVWLTTFAHTLHPFYEFECPDCEDQIRVPCDTIVADMLRKVKVPEECLQVPGEVLEESTRLPWATGETSDLFLDMYEAKTAYEFTLAYRNRQP